MREKQLCFVLVDTSLSFKYLFDSVEKKEEAVHMSHKSIMSYKLNLKKLCQKLQQAISHEVKPNGILGRSHNLKLSSYHRKHIANIFN